MKTSIHIYYSILNSEKSDSLAQDMLSQLPDNMRARALRYKSTTAANQFLLGRYLLRDGLHKIGSNDSWTSLSYSSRGKPRLPNTIFNISHSGDLVLCAFSTYGELGVDVEIPKNTDVQNLRHSFTDKEWQSIQNKPDQLYSLWCRKEAVLKAADVSLQSLHKIEADSFSDQIFFENHSWFILSLDFLQDHHSYGAICTKYAIDNLFIERVFY